MRPASSNAQTHPRGLAVAVAAALLVLAVTLFMSVAVRGPVSIGSQFGALVRADRPGALIVLLVSLVLLLVQSYAVRYLQDESYRNRFHVLALLAATGAALSAVAAGPATFAFGWVVSGAALVGLVSLDRRTRPAEEALRRVCVSELVSGLCVAVAAVVSVAGGASEFQSIASASSSGGAILSNEASFLVAGALLIATAARCAQLFGGRWLQMSLSAPTPVSALMHAGLVNAGFLLAIRFGGVTFSVRWAAIVLFLLAACTIIVATSAMIARPDVKGSLALSTRAQMGFMLVQCALGAFSGALFHLFSHGLYKAALFLGAGQAIDQQRNAEAVSSPRESPGTARTLAQMAIASAIPVIALGSAVVVLMPGAIDHPAKIALLAFAWSTAAQTLWWWLRLRGPGALGSISAIVAVAALSWSYVAAYALFSGFMDPFLPRLVGAAPAWLVLPLFAAVTLSTALRWLAESGLADERLRAVGRSRTLLALYSRALDFGLFVPYGRKRLSSPTTREVTS